MTSYRECDSRDFCDEQSEELEALQAHIKVLEDALRPFAKLWAPDIDEAKLKETDQIECYPTVAALRTASAAMKGE